MEFSAEGNVKIIFGLKVRKLRSDARLSLQQLSERTGISISYLNEIEKGKKYPKSDKIADLARALGVGYDQLISQKLNKNLAPVGEILALDVFSDLPFDNFGIARNVLFGMIANAPAKMAAFVNTIIEVARYYTLKQEHFYFSCLRSLQEMTDNHFEDLELAADQSWAIELAASAGLHLRRLMQVKSRPAHTPHVCLMEYSPEPGALTEESICIHSGTGNTYSAAFMQLTGPYYLRFPSV